MSAPEQLILASKSASRRAMLDGVALDYQAMPADLDERAIAQKYTGNPRKMAIELARQKALAVAGNNPDALVIGSDSLVELDGKVYNKADTPEEAVNKILSLSGKTHHLISAVAVARGGIILWDYCDSAAMTMRTFDRDFAQNYIQKIGAAAMDCVGAYQLEALGPWLFEKIEGDYFTILGMPLVQLLGYLQDYHGVKL
ncbi:MAG: septum formation protein Maf [Micavibrio sp.]|nr:septum formation protein Maf [Micavibrio sp.]|tara:strand:- start:614 stop:1210 length:597 start_codon:yes stop_codon:yes gene_type:complete